MRKSPKDKANFWPHHKKVVLLVIVIFLVFFALMKLDNNLVFLQSKYLDTIFISTSNMLTGAAVGTKEISTETISPSELSGVGKKLLNYKWYILIFTLIMVFTMVLIRFRPWAPEKRVKKAVSQPVSEAKTPPVTEEILWERPQIKKWAKVKELPKESALYEEFETVNYMLKELDTPIIETKTAPKKVRLIREKDPIERQLNAELTKVSANLQRYQIPKRRIHLTSNEELEQELSFVGRKIDELNTPAKEVKSAPKIPAIKDKNFMEKELERELSKISANLSGFKSQKSSIQLTSNSELEKELAFAKKKIEELDSLT